MFTHIQPRHIIHLSIYPSINKDKPVVNMYVYMDVPVKNFIIMYVLCPNFYW